MSEAVNPIQVYCLPCSAAPGTPCSSPLTGQELDGFHAWRIESALAETMEVTSSDAPAQPESTDPQPEEGHRG